ncbi:MAG: hypothetical protein WC358_08945 [Ignavibacteria bacterium]|jgi:hypothetical protein
MNKAKFIFSILILSFLIMPFELAKADGGEKGTSKSVISLNNQLYNEISDVLNLPVYLAYEDKNLKGDAIVTMKVSKDGKLVIANVLGKNETLNKYIYTKICSRNLWTPQKYADQYLRYKIHVK